MPLPRVYRLLLVDDHVFVRRAIRRMLELDPALCVAAETSSFRQALRAVRTECPDLVLMDLVLPGEDGLHFIREVRRLRPSLPILVVSLHKESLFAEAAIRAGADGFLMKSDAPDHLVEAAHRVLGREIYLSPPMKQALFERMRGVDRGGARHASARRRRPRAAGRRVATGSGRRVHSSAR